MQNFRGKTKSTMVFLKVAYSLSDVPNSTSLLTLPFVVVPVQQFFASSSNFYWSNRNFSRSYSYDVNDDSISHFASYYVSSQILLANVYI